MQKVLKFTYTNLRQPYFSQNSYKSKLNKDH